MKHRRWFKLIDVLLAVFAVPLLFFWCAAGYYFYFASKTPDDLTKSAAIAAGRELYEQKNCQSCHGAGGSLPIDENYPKLAGQNANYLIGQFSDIKSDKRSNGMTALMRSEVQDISQAEIEQIAVYLESLK